MTNTLVYEDGLEAAWINREGFRFEPVMEDGALGYRITNPDTGRVEYILLNPSQEHEINPEDGCVADTFVYHLDQDAADEYHEAAEHSAVASAIDFGDPLVYANHFYGAWQPPSPDDHDNTEL